MNEQNTINNQHFEDFERLWFNSISLAERKLDKIMPLFPLEKQERINMAYEKICEIPDFEERAFVLGAYVNELERVRKLYAELMNK